MITPEQLVLSPLGDNIVREIQRRVTLSLSDDPKDWHEVGENFQDYLGEVPKLLGRMTEGELWEIVVDGAIDIQVGVLCDCQDHVCVEFYPADGWTSPWSGKWFQDVAEEILNCQASAWWSAPRDERQQICLVEGIPTGPGEFKPRNMALSPKEVLLWTSSRIGGRPSSEEGYMASRSLGNLFGNEFASWKYYRVQVEPTKPVYEVDSQQDWATLCEYAPVKMQKYQYAGYVEPDWARIAKQWSGIHVTVNGLISCLNVEVATSAGLAIMAHWIYERTAWLEWVVSGFEPLEDIPGSTRKPPEPIPPRLQEIIDRAPSPPSFSDLPDDLPSVSGYGPIS